MPGVVPELRRRILGLEAAASAAPGAGAPQPPAGPALAALRSPAGAGLELPPETPETTGNCNSHERSFCGAGAAHGSGAIPHCNTAERSRDTFPRSSTAVGPSLQRRDPRNLSHTRTKTHTPSFSPVLLCSPCRRPAAAEPGPPRGCANAAGSRPEPHRRCRAPAPQPRGLTGSSGRRSRSCARAGAQLMAGAHGLGEELLTLGRPTPLPSANC